MKTGKLQSACARALAKSRIRLRVPPDHGPFPTNPEQIIRDYVKACLKEPISAECHSFSGPIKGSFRKGLFFGGWSTIPAYVVRFVINIKHSYGGRIGSTEHFALIRNDQLVYATPYSDNIRYGEVVE